MALQDKAVLVDFSVGKWTGSKQDKGASREITANHNADSDAAVVIKRLVPKDWLEPLTKIKSQADKVHHTYTSPWFRDGQSILSSALILEYQQKMQRYRLDWDKSVDAEIMPQYKTVIADAPKKLGSLFNPGDYPSEQRMRTKFYFRMIMLPVPSTDDFRITLGQDEQDNLVEMIKEQEKRITQELWGRLYGVTQKLASGLEEYVPGQREGCFRDSLVGNIEELVNLLPRMNVAGDVELDRMVDEVRKKLTRFSAQDLRVNQDIRQITKDKVNALLANMVGYCGEVDKWE